MGQRFLLIFLLVFSPNFASAGRFKDFCSKFIFQPWIEYRLMPEGEPMAALVLKYEALIQTGSAIELALTGERIRFYLQTEATNPRYKGQLSDQEKNLAYAALAKGVWKEYRALFF